MPDTAPSTTELLLDLLKRAAAAHHMYEQGELKGVYDKDWPQWYAEHMTKALAASGYRLVKDSPR